MTSPPNVFMKCTHGSRYERNIERASTRGFIKNVPRKPRLKRGKVFTSAITRYLIDKGHRISITKWFKISREERTWLLLCFVEAITMKVLSLESCIHRKIMVNVTLPWQTNYIVLTSVSYIVCSLCFVFKRIPLKFT